MQVQKDVLTIEASHEHLIEHTKPCKTLKIMMYSHLHPGQLEKPI